MNSTNPNVTLDLGPVNPDTYEMASELTSLTCITVLAVALGAKTYGEKLKTLNYGRALVILLYSLSWAFAVTSIVVVSTNNHNIISCTLGMLSCDFFYAGSKIVAYAWLIERVHLVTAVKTTRLKTAQYRFHILLLCPYIIIFALMLSFRNIYLEADGTCMIGLQDIASIPLLVYDFIFNLYLTWLFMRPLTNIGRNTRTDWKVTRLYKLARRTLVASIMCLSISFLNVLLVVLTHGHQRGLVCLTMCTVDVTVNVVTVHWVTTSGSSSSGNGRTKTHNDDHMTADMTFDADEAKHHEKSMKFDGPMIQPHIDDDGTSTKSAEISYKSEKPISNYYN
ncbi:hypothetical protein G6F70_003015 [Rhizopus microsporus]|uniref:G-protein coupled receptors family 2 profile 2 domain-containing protein n=2 Tax=Rhizopus TaxID=4842 RepID=A0A367K7H8_RHIAZ|nr:hypothetical protein G6F71_002319 [Rhizopus microsporus]RCH98164.1 hypothetical protein CU097_006410 [Rhizopus azygosporus]KAG1201575.1 hypothetical protein G6F70_003015 [Rhizopus microsporus]KAG1214557.1 hypothetical protein G6F69_001789 [Rhizopus microsporus]KAG1238942.1 hypothetical protein G6F67_000040 [Rhizopus microsporus]